MQLRRCSAALVCGLDVWVMAVTSQSARQAPRHLRHADEWLAAAGTDRAALELSAAVLWVIAVWLAVAVLSALASTAPGTLGPVATAVVEHTTPRAVRVALVSLLGLSVVLAPAVAQASAVGTASAASASGAAGAAGAASPAGPASAVGARSAPTVTASAKPATPSRSISPYADRRAVGVPGTGVDRSPSAPGATNAAPQPRIGWPRSPETPGSSAAGARPGTTPPANRPTEDKATTSRPTLAHHPGQAVTVSPGDSLWLIAAHRLATNATPAHIADAWPRWYAANRRVIGPHPDCIQPGQHLAAPTQEGTSQ